MSTTTPTPVQEVALVTADGVSAITLAYPANVATDHLLVVVAGRYDAGGTAAFTAAQCTQSAGTATTGAVTRDAHSESSGGSEPQQSAIWSLPVTAGGSATIRVSSSNVGCYFWLQINEYATADVSDTRVDGVPGSNLSNVASTPATTGNTTSTDKALFVAALATDYGGANLNPVVGGGFTQLGASTNGGAHQTGASARKIVASGASTEQCSWAIDTAIQGGWDACIVAYKGLAVGYRERRQRRRSDQRAWRASSSTRERRRGRYRDRRRVVELHASRDRRDERRAARRACVDERVDRHACTERRYRVRRDVDSDDWTRTVAHGERRDLDGRCCDDLDASQCDRCGWRATRRA
jgi:hypothetical protein